VKVLVCGGRDYVDERRIHEALSLIHRNRAIAHLIHGDCRGADRVGLGWAILNGIPSTAFPADWDNIDAPGARIRFRNGRPYNAAAGMQRNSRMIQEGSPDLVVAFPGGRGTKNCVDTALKLGVAVMSVDA
jgi:hypothetical protein